MLIDTTTQIKVGDILALKLANGEEIITRLAAISDIEFTITRPLMVTLVSAPSGGANVAFVPWSLAMPEQAQIKLQRSNIMAHAKARDDATASYIKQTSSLEIPTGAGLIV